ncbi:hypothetical protein V2161_04025 [Klebsiella pneumoniae]|uniref:hypothetical protein n=1 Tax=Klebsiella TaxID=570 RepID=UPI000E2CE10E|nr:MULTISPECIES: hypothetical protein [Klebsiella]MBU9999418.1 hypothetical protein [Klebsiella michiganensis]MDW1470642.1 hypothetical protein [Klebsiella pneumoniae]SXN59262.1 Uncharacterised protein [Klebsiella pneumoniae]HBX7247142.1 hypothetical protein [Klebsiella pneumoniae]
MPEKTETKTNFDQTASPLKGIKNIMTPAGAVMRVTDTDLKWFTHFYTFEAQGKKCYQSIKRIAKEFDRAVSVAQERIDKLQALGLLEVGKETFKDGWRNTYTCTPIDVIVSRMTEAPVTPQDKPLKKSQLNSLLKKSGKVDSHAVNRGIKAMAKTIANRDLSDEEVMQFAFQIATEKLAALGWPIESIIEESNDEEDLQPATDGPETASPIAGKPDGVPVVDIPVDADLSGSDDPSLSDSTGRNVVELPRNGRPKLSFKFVSPDDDDLENYSEAPQVDFDKDGQPPNKWKDFDMATTCDLLYDL